MDAIGPVLSQRISHTIVRNGVSFSPRAPFSASVTSSPFEVHQVGQSQALSSAFTAILQYLGVETIRVHDNLLSRFPRLFDRIQINPNTSPENLASSLADIIFPKGLRLEIYATDKTARFYSVAKQKPA